MDKLFEEWRQRHFKKGYDYFNIDGIINSRIWEKQKIKICFFLKEAYQEESHIWNLAKWLCNENGGAGAVKKMWKTAAELTYGILHTTENFIPSYAETAALSDSMLSDLLQKTAVINVKKSNGKSASDWCELVRYAADDADLIRREIELIAPNVIICGNNSSLLRIVYGASFDEKYNVMQDGEMDESICAFMKANGYVWFKDKLIIDFWHPANHFPKMMNYYTLCCIYQKALEDKER